MEREVAAALEREALRVYRRYAREFVETFRVCPWAEHAQATGKVRERVLMHERWSEPEVLHEVGVMEVDDQVEIGLLIFPRLAMKRLDFERAVAALFQAAAARRESAIMAMAAFHPDVEPDMSAPERLVPFMRSSPDPTVQLVRRTVLERVRGTEPRGTGFVSPAELGKMASQADVRVPLHERVARDNYHTMQDLGVERARAILSSIRADRDAAYARVLGGTEGAS